MTKVMIIMMMNINDVKSHGESVADQIEDSLDLPNYPEMYNVEWFCPKPDGMSGRNANLRSDRERQQIMAVVGSPEWRQLYNPVE